MLYFLKSAHPDSHSQSLSPRYFLKRSLSPALTDWYQLFAKTPMLLLGIETLPQNVSEERNVRVFPRDDAERKGGSGLSAIAIFSS